MVAVSSDFAPVSSYYKKFPFVKKAVAVKRYNTIQRKRKIRLASFVPAPRLVKGFHNKPVMK